MFYLLVVYRNVLIDNAEDFVLIDNAEDVVMPMYNLIEYRKNYRKTTRSLWNYNRDELNNPTADYCIIIMQIL